MPDTSILTALRDGVTALGSLAQAIRAVFPTIQSTAPSATAGTNGAPPAQVRTYLVITLPDGSTGKVPVYNV